MMAASGAEARDVLLSPDSPRVVLLDGLLPDHPGHRPCARFSMRRTPVLI